MLRRIKPYTFVGCALAQPDRVILLTSLAPSLVPQFDVHDVGAKVGDIRMFIVGRGMYICNTEPGQVLTGLNKYTIP